MVDLNRGGCLKARAFLRIAPLMKSKARPLSVYTILRAAVSAFLFCLCCGATALAGSMSSNLSAEPAVVNFGEVMQQRVLEAKIKLTNKGNEPISILSITTSCECTVATSADAMIAPGKDTTLTIKSETRDQTGNVRRAVIIHATSGDLMVPVEMAVVPPDSASQARSEPK